MVIKYYRFFPVVIERSLLAKSKTFSSKRAYTLIEKVLDFASKDLPVTAEKNLL